jgi:hypothetical protein
LGAGAAGGAAGLFGPKGGNGTNGHGPSLANGGEEKDEAAAREWVEREMVKLEGEMDEVKEAMQL